MGTLCSRQNAVLDKLCEMAINFSLYLPFPLTHISPHWVLRDGTGSSAFLDKVIVREDEEVNKSSSACSSLGGGGDEILQCRVESDGRDQVLLFNS